MNNILIIGAGKGGTALIELFSTSETVKIIGVVDTDKDAPGIKMAEKLGIPVSDNYKDFIGNDDLDEVINVTGSDHLQQELIDNKPDKMEVIGAHGTQIFWGILENYRSASDQMRKEQQYNELIFCLVPSAIFSVDKDRRITSWNRMAEEITGYTAEEILGQECTVFAKDPCTERCGVFSGDIENTAIDRECTLRSKDGNEHAILKNVSIVRDDDGNITGAVETFKDITSQKKTQRVVKETMDALEQQRWGLEKTNEAIKVLYKELETKNKELQRLNEMKSNFVSQVSHEFKNPLHIIRESFNIVLDGTMGAIRPKQAKFLESGKRNAERLIRLVTNLLDISSIEAGKIKMGREEVDLESLCIETVETYQSQFDRKGIILKTDIAKDTGIIWGDTDRLSQVVINLLTNAMKYTPAKGSVTLRLMGDEKEMRLEIIDTGPGIPEEYTKKIFDKFERITVEKEEGTGLGLPIAQDIVMLHHGQIWIESEEGKGSKFIVILPRDLRQNR